MIEDDDDDKEDVEDKKRDEISTSSGKLIGGVAIAALIGGAGYIAYKSLRSGARKPKSKLPNSAKAFAKELVWSGESYAKVIEANNPLNKDLTEEEEEDFADAVEEEVKRKIMQERQNSEESMRQVIREELSRRDELKRNFASNVLAGAVVSGITMAVVAFV